MLCTAAVTALVVGCSARQVTARPPTPRPASTSTARAHNVTGPSDAHALVHGTADIVAGRCPSTAIVWAVPVRDLASAPDWRFRDDLLQLAGG
jgi:hypothetical protein